MTSNLESRLTALERRHPRAAPVETRMTFYLAETGAVIADFVSTFDPATGRVTRRDLPLSGIVRPDRIPRTYRPPRPGDSLAHNDDDHDDDEADTD